MPSTPTYALPYPAGTQPPDVPTDIQALANQIEAAFGELAYAEKTTDTTVTVTTEATATTVVSAAAITLSASTALVVEFFAPAVTAGLGGQMILWLYDGNSLGALATEGGPSGGNPFHPVHLTRRLVAASGSHTYSVRASVGSGGSGTISGGPGGAGQNVPAFIRVTRA